MKKVSFFDGRVFRIFREKAAAVFALLSIVLIFVDIPEFARLWAGLGVLALSVISYCLVWRWANKLNAVSVEIEGSVVDVKVGDIFSQPGLKVISFNEYFDTAVDDRVISRASLNGIFIENVVGSRLADFEAHIRNYSFDEDAIVQRFEDRADGRSAKYRLGTICVYEDFLLTAFSKFDDHNQASMTMPEYLDFLISFWDKVNRVYAQKSVSVTVFGSGITRIQGHRSISDEDLLKIMLWTFRISEMRFKYPAKLTIVIHESKIDKINLLDIQSAKNGL